MYLRGLSFLKSYHVTGRKIHTVTTDIIIPVISASNAQGTVQPVFEIPTLPKYIAIV